MVLHQNALGLAMSQSNPRHQYWANSSSERWIGYRKGEKKYEPIHTVFHMIITVVGNYLMQDHELAACRIIM